MLNLIIWNVIVINVSNCRCATDRTGQPAQPLQKERYIHSDLWSKAVPNSATALGLAPDTIRSRSVGFPAASFRIPAESRPCDLTLVARANGAQSQDDVGGVIRRGWKSLSRFL